MEARPWLRHGFANRFLRESGRDVAALRGILGHSRIDTTQLYTDDLDADELANALAQAVEVRELQASSEPITGGGGNPQVPSKPVDGGGGNRTRVRSRTG